MSIHQEITYKSSPQLIFDALTNSDKFEALTGDPADILPETGGKFSCFGGAISGISIELVANKRLVQAWRVADWEPGIYSIAKFELEKINASETKLIFDHTGFPEEHRVHLEQGWHDRYWDPIRKYLEA